MNLYVISTPSQDGQVTIGQQAISLPSAGLRLVVAAEPVEALAHCSVYAFAPASVLPVYSDLKGTQRPPLTQAVLGNDWLAMAANPTLLAAVETMAGQNPSVMLRFVLTYCYAVNPAHTLSVMRRLIDFDRDLYDFVEQHRLQPWTVADFALALGLPTRKFTLLFKEKFGVTAKRWLLEQRLDTARQQLLLTPKKIIDIAFETGFCSPAHFTDSFRRRFRQTPSQARRETIGGLAHTPDAEATMAME